MIANNYPVYDMDSPKGKPTFKVITEIWMNEEDLAIEYDNIKETEKQEIKKQKKKQQENDKSYGLV